MISIGTQIPHIRHTLEDDFKSDEERYHWQMAVRANYLLLGDKKVNIPIDIIRMPKSVLTTTIKWINRGELITGSFMSNAVQGANIEANDVDIYFKDEADVKLFMHDNSLIRAFYKDEIAVHAKGKNIQFNLIFGIKFDDAEDLISHFDIRACSIALDPCTNTVYSVAGALSDCCIKRIVYNPVPHNTTLARLVKYAKKGFDIDAYQRLFLAELIKSEQYNIDLELSTGYRAVHK